MSLRPPDIVGVAAGAVAAAWAPLKALVPDANAAELRAGPEALAHPLAMALQELLARREAPAQASLLALMGTDLCRHWTLAAPRGVASFGELRAVAAAQCCRLFGGAEDDWRIVADWRLGPAFVCAALPSRVVNALQAVCTGAGVRLQIESALLRAARALERWLPRDGWCAWPTPASLVLLARRGGRIEWLHASCRPSTTSAQALVEAGAGEIVRHCLRSGEPAPRTLTWLGAGSGHVDSPTRIDVRTVPQGTTGLPSWQLVQPGTAEAGWALAVGAGDDTRSRP